MTAPFPSKGGVKLESAAPRLAEGLELLGEYKDSGFKEPPFLARRADGQVLQLPRLLYLVAASSDGSRSYGQIAEAVTERSEERRVGKECRSRWSADH